MAMGGEPVEQVARARVDGGGGGKAGAMIDVENGGLAHADVESELARFAQASASNPTVSPPMEVIITHLPFC